ncbi:hypothetical protein BDW42DRAFT_33876 [Aspergillus taichungensis]|uniref:Uncharacterized protein n=1 Tax=Aspergillus taichungensis TaxID=482145 RepID=A0A2J5HFK7_9EURO|nr:hypothetical protein BDW42DRAFT_33876 [Aspergillus taichungensis]
MQLAFYTTSTNSSTRPSTKLPDIRARPDRALPPFLRTPMTRVSCSPVLWIPILFRYILSTISHLSTFQTFQHLDILSTLRVLLINCLRTRLCPVLLICLPIFSFFFFSLY